MNETPENPPAFPNTGNSTWNLKPTDGMTLRDWFAGQALTGFITACSSFSEIRDDETCAIRAYAMADAMLEERAK